MTGEGPGEGREMPKPRLRIGLLLESLQVTSWQWALLRRLQESDYACICLVILLERLPSRSPCTERGIAAWLRAIVDGVNNMLERRITLERDALATREAGELLAAVPTLRAGTEEEDALRSEVSAHDIDLFVNLVSAPLPGFTWLRAKYGVWSLQHGDARAGFGNPRGFWEVFTSSAGVASSLLVTDGSHGAKIVDRTFSSTDRTSVLRNNNGMYWRSVALIPRRLMELHKLGPQAFARRTVGHADTATGLMVPGRPPTTFEVARLVARMCCRGLRDKIEDWLYLWQWILLFHLGDGPCSDMTRFRKLIPPKDRYWADPMVLAREGKYYIFIEEVPFSTNKGHISVIVMDERGHYEAPVKVLERPYHLSYPFVFESEGVTYMVPESADNGTVELYRCVEFPLQWELAENLLENVCAVDATLIRHDEKWWLFANMADTPADSTWEELFLFHSDALLDGTWRPHPLNPIVSDVMRARPAGPLHWHAGKLYRPGQDCSVRYGYGIRVQEITRLTEDDYAEIDAATLMPTWDKAIIAVHTLTHAGRLTVIDALQPRFKI